MATINGLTAAAMRAIRDGAIVGASVDVSGHLMLEKFDGTFLDTGSVVGPVGPMGPAGPVPEAPGDSAYYVRRNGAWVPVPVPAVGEAPSDSVYYTRRNGVWAPVPVPTPQKVGGWLTGLDGSFGGSINTNTSVHAEFNSGTRLTFTSPASGKVCVIGELEVVSQVGVGHGGGWGIAEVSDIANPHLIGPWGANGPGLSEPIVGVNHGYSFAKVMPYTLFKFNPGEVVTLTMTALKIYGPTGASGSVILNGTYQVFAVNEGVVP